MLSEKLGYLEVISSVDFSRAIYRFRFERLHRCLARDMRSSSIAFSWIYGQESSFLSTAIPQSTSRNIQDPRPKCSNQILPLMVLCMFRRFLGLTISYEQLHPLAHCGLTQLSKDTTWNREHRRISLLSPTTASRQQVGGP